MATVQNLKINGNNIASWQASSANQAITYSTSGSVYVSDDYYHRQYRNTSLYDLYKNDVNLSENTLYIMLIDDAMSIERKREFVNNLIDERPLSESFLQRVYEYANEEKLYSYQTVSMKFIEEHLNKNNITYILRHQNITKKFIDTHKNDENFSWYELLKNYKVELSANYIIKNKKAILKNLESHVVNENDNSVNILLRHYNANNENYNKLLSTLIDKYEGELDYDFISWSKWLDEDNIYRMLDRLDFNAPLLKNRTYENPIIECYNRA